MKIGLIYWDPVKFLDIIDNGVLKSSDEKPDNNNYNNTIVMKKNNLSFNNAKVYCFLNYF